MKKPVFLIMLILLFVSCKEEAPISLEKEGKISRIVCLSPSITAQIIDLESSHLIVGVTTYSPPLNHEVEVIGTLTNPNTEKIILLKPDAVLYSSEDEAVQKTEQLASMGIKLFSFKKNSNYKTICDNYIYLAQIIGKEELANKKLALYNKQLEEIRTDTVKSQIKPLVAFFVSQEPLIAVSSLSFISGIIDDAGGINVYHNLEKAYPLVSAESLITLKPDIILSIMPDAKKFFTGINNVYMKNKKNYLDNIYSINPDNAALYTPANYVKSVEEVWDKINTYLKNRSENQLQ